MTNAAKNKVVSITEFREASELSLVDLKQGGTVKGLWNFRSDNASVKVGTNVDTSVVLSAADAKKVEVMGAPFEFKWSAAKTDAVTPTTP